MSLFLGHVVGDRSGDLQTPTDKDVGDLENVRSDSGVYKRLGLITWRRSGPFRGSGGGKDRARQRCYLVSSGDGIPGRGMMIGHMAIQWGRWYRQEWRGREGAASDSDKSQSCALVRLLRICSHGIREMER